MGWPPLLIGRVGVAGAGGGTLEAEMPMSRTFHITTREEDVQADRRSEWAKTPQQRLADMEFLRAQRYPNGIAPRLTRTLEVVEPARR